MQVKYLKYVKKWVLVYHGKALAVGNTPSEAITEGFRVLLVIYPLSIKFNK